MCISSSNFSCKFKINKKMTGTTSSTGRSFFDVDAYRNQEWLRRRKLRLEQVRKQSSEIARALREKVINHDKLRLDEYDRVSEAKFIKWKENKLDELERKIFSALEEFGEGYRMAEEEPVAEELMKERYQINQAKAQIRGEIALQEEMKRKKLAEENKYSGIQRKKLIRKKEDLRSALVLSIPVKKQLIESHPDSLEEKIQADKGGPTSVKQRIIEPDILNIPKKVCPTRKKGKKISPQKSCKCKTKTKNLEADPKKSGNTIWINLNEIQNSMGGSELQLQSSKSSGRSEKSSKDRLEKGTVEFFDFSSRYYCRSFKEFPHSVERIDPESEVPTATDLAKIEEDVEKAEARKKAKADILSQERGMEALRRERINTDFHNLMSKLEELNRKEKMLKAQQRNLPDLFYMSDERLDRKLQTRQRMMDLKFESICYEAVTQLPRRQPPEQRVFNRKGEGDFEAGRRPSTRLGFSPVSLNLISPYTSEGDSSGESSPEERFRHTKETFGEKQLLVDIDTALKEGRELRKAAYHSLKSISAEEDEVKEKENAKEENNSSEVSPATEKEKTKCQESQTENAKPEEDVNALEENKEDSLPVSSSTSYKSPPSVITSTRLRQFLEYLEGVSEAGGSGPLKGNSKPTDKINELFHDFLHANNFNGKSSEENRKSGLSPTLEYYIEKLLNMSRESVAELSVSSENVSTPNITDLDMKDSKPPVVPTFFTASRAEDLIRKSRMDRADQLEKTIKNWKLILEDSKGQSEAEGVPDCPRLDSTGEEKEKKDHKEPVDSPKIKKKYEEITKKCSERISELSNMLDKVRKDKEKLLTSTSGGSSGSLSKDGRNSEKDFDEDGEDSDVDSLRKTSRSMKNLKATAVEEFLDRYNIPARRETVSTTAVADSQSFQDLEESLESWPDVMDELLKRKILTSPFKWSEGEHSSEFTTNSGNQTKPSSVETVIGNFRREISKIKPFTLSDSLPKSSAFDEKRRALFSSPKSGVSSGWQQDNESPFREESSVESINQALTNLGLNWAKSFLKKNEESNAISSSSNSEGESSNSETDEFP